MKRFISIAILLLMMYVPSHAQLQKRQLVIYSITEYIDGYVIKAVDTSKHDTLSIISLKQAMKNTRNFERLIVGKRYEFEFEDLISKMAAAPPDNFVARIKTTVVWRNGDAVSSIPVYSQNLKGIWIKK